MQLETIVVNGASNLAGLSSEEAARRRAEFGPNAVVEQHAHPLMRVARHFWAPVPWMLEATIVLQIAIGQRVTALLIAMLLVFNVALGAIQESRADAALALLKQRLSLKSRVKRDGSWIDAPAAELVPDDIVQVSLGEVVPADIVIVGGSFTPEGKEKPAKFSVRNEAHNGLKNIRGTIAMARQPDVRDSARAQFFINVADNPALDHKDQDNAAYGYCVFGHVVQGLDVVDRIANSPVKDAPNFESTPIQQVLIKAIHRVP